MKNAVISEVLTDQKGQKPTAGTGQAGKEYDDDISTLGGSAFTETQRFQVTLPNMRPYFVQIQPCLANNVQGKPVDSNSLEVSGTQVLINKDAGSTDLRECFK